MITRKFKKLTSILSKREGSSLVAIIAILIIMSVMGGVFSSIMGRWKLSSPSNINSSKAAYLAETAAMYALQDAKYRFYGGNFNFGASGAPYVVSTSGTEEADYWFEMPGINDDDGPTEDGDSGSDSNDDGDSDSSGDEGSSGDDESSGDSDDDDSNDDADDVSNPTRYTIIATGRVKRGGTIVAKRQIKIKADITDSSGVPIEPGVHTDGCIQGTGASATHFDMENPTTSANVAYEKTCNVVTAGSETGIVYRPSKTLDEYVFKAMAQDQGHYHAGNFSVTDGYPNSSYYYSGSVPNFIYVEGDFTMNGNLTAYGVYWINGTTTVFNGNYQMNGIIISVGDITMNGGGSVSPNMNGGIIQYGVSSTLTGNGQPVEISINEGYFTDLDSALTIINVVSWQEAVSAN